MRNVLSLYVSSGLSIELCIREGWSASFFLSSFFFFSFLLYFVLFCLVFVFFFSLLDVEVPSYSGVSSGR